MVLARHHARVIVAVVVVVVAAVDAVVVVAVAQACASIKVKDSSTSSIAICTPMNLLQRLHALSSKYLTTHSSPGPETEPSASTAAIKHSSLGAGEVLFSSCRM